MCTFLGATQLDLQFAQGLHFPSKVSMAKKTYSCDLGRLRKGMPGLTPAAGGYLAEAAAVCLEHQSHIPGISLSVDGSYGRTVRLSWERVGNQERLTYADLHEATEYGACGIAILVVENAARKVVVKRSKKGTFFDYWVGLEGKGELFQGDRARLEVSGILDGDDKKIEMRTTQKLEQVKQAKGKLPTYVAVIEFGRPKARVLRK